MNSQKSFKALNCVVNHQLCPQMKSLMKENENLKKENYHQKAKLERYLKMFEKLEESKKIIGVLYYCIECDEYRDNDSEIGEIHQDCDGNDIWWGNNCSLCGEVWEEKYK
jgi:hypothetical protein